MRRTRRDKIRARRLILACGSLLVAAMATQRLGAAPLRRTPAEFWQSSRGALRALLILTNEPTQFLAEWNTPPSVAPRIASVTTVPRGREITAFVFFTGCAARANACDAVADFTVFRPDGSVYASHPNQDLWRGKPPPPNGNIQLSTAALGIRIEPRDPLGAYRLRVRVRDRIAATSIAIERSFLALHD